MTKEGKVVWFTFDGALGGNEMGRIWIGLDLFGIGFVWDCDLTDRLVYNRFEFAACQ